MLSTLTTTSWTEAFSLVEQENAIKALEDGKIIYLPQLPFQLDGAEKALLTPDILVGASKNVSYNPSDKTVKGAIAPEVIAPFMQRFFEHSRYLIESLIPHYKNALQDGRTSYRPIEVAGRKMSLLKDDTRLHVDAFPATPNQGRRILRVFSNINPANQYRLWHVGEPFEKVVSQFLPKLRRPLFGSHQLLSWLKITKTVRSLYDHYMLLLHNEMKKSDHYQSKVSKTAIPFLAGATWIVMTDVVSHAAISGQFMLEQTFYLPVESMKAPEKSPLHILEKALDISLCPHLTLP